LRWSTKNYRDDPDDGPNLAPRRSSMYDDAYPSPLASGQKSSSDPMATHMGAAAAAAAAIAATEAAPAPSSSSSSSTEYENAIRDAKPSSEDDGNAASEYGESKPPTVYIGPPRDEDGHELHSVEII